MKEVWNQLAHLVVAVVILIWPCVWPASCWSWTLSAFLTAVVREDADHRPDEGWRWPTPWTFEGIHKGKPTRIGGYRRWIDILAWSCGGPLVWLIRSDFMEGVAMILMVIFLGFLLSLWDVVRAFIPQIAKALVPLVLAGLAWLASHVPGVETPPVGAAEWIAATVVAFFVWLIPNKQKSGNSGG